MGCLLSQLNGKVSNFKGVDLLKSQMDPSTLVVIGGAGGRDDANTYHYKIDDTKWNFNYSQLGKNPDNVIYNVGSSVVGSLVFLVGGYQPKQACIYNTTSGEFEALPDLETGRAKGPSVYVLQGTLYASGGHNWSTINTTSQLFLDGGRWTTCPVSLPYPVADAQAVVVGDRVYIPGGFQAKNQYLKSMISWSEGESSWTVHAEMSEARGGHGAVYCNGNIYVMGGDGGTEGLRSSVECYDIENNCWISKANLPLALTGIGCSVHGNNIVVCGGQERDAETVVPSAGNTDKIYIYNTAEDKWQTSATTLQSETYDHVAAIV